MKGEIGEAFYCIPTAILINITIDGLNSVFDR